MNGSWLIAGIFAWLLIWFVVTLPILLGWEVAASVYVLGVIAYLQWGASDNLKGWIKQKYRWAKTMRWWK